MLRDLLVFAIVAAGLPYAFTRPFFGLLMFTWMAYMRPQDLCWGPARSFRFSLYVAVAMYVGYFLFEKRPFTRYFPQRKWFFGLALFSSISLYANEIYSVENQIGKWIDLLKVFLVALFTVGMVDSKKRLDLIMLVIALGLGFYGVKCGMFGVFTGGRILQGPGGMLKDNNDLSLALNMVIPLLFYLSITSKDPRLKKFLLIAVFFTACAVIFTRSRGGFLALVAVGCMLVWRSRQRWVGFGTGAVVALLFFLFMPADVRERLATLKDPTEEGSAAGRLYAWGVALNMAKANPLTGVGFNAFVYNFRRYDDTPGGESGDAFVRVAHTGETSVRVAHNSYLQLLAETGVPALFCFLSLIVSSILMMRRVQRMVRTRDGPLWAYYYASAIEVSLVAFVVGATFLNRAHFDLLYHLVAVSACIWRVATMEMEKQRLTRASPQEPLEPADPWKSLPQPLPAPGPGIS